MKPKASYIPKSKRGEIVKKNRRGITMSARVFQFDALSERAKEKARDWYRDGALDFDWHDCIYDDAARIGLKITSFDLGRSQSIKSELTESVSEVCRRILSDHGKSCRTYKTALSFFVDRHKGITRGQESDYVDHFRRDLEQNYWYMLQDEMEYILSDESVDENIRCNEYTFTKEGERF